jgi:hypothetical protein
MSLPTTIATRAYCRRFAVRARCLVAIFFFVSLHPPLLSLMFALQCALRLHSQTDKHLHRTRDTTDVLQPMARRGRGLTSRMRRRSSARHALGGCRGPKSLTARMLPCTGVCRNWMTTHTRNRRHSPALLSCSCASSQSDCAGAISTHATTCIAFMLFCPLPSRPC